MTSTFQMIYHQPSTDHAHIEELDKLGQVRIHARRLIVKEIITLKNTRLWKFPIADNTVKVVCKKEYDIRKSIEIRDQSARSHDFRRYLQKSSEKFTSIDKAEEDDVALTFQISLLVLTSNLDFSSTCRKKKLSQFF